MSAPSKIIFLGSGSFGLPALEALYHSRHALERVVTSCDKPKGRFLTLQPTPIKKWAFENNVPVSEFTKENSARLLEEIQKIKPDFFIVIAFGFLLKAPWLNCPARMCLNVHPSLLPKYRGAAPIHWPLINGELETGVSIIRMNEKLDSGDIAFQKRIPIAESDDFLSLESKLARLGTDALAETIERVLAGEASLRPQDDSLATYARKLSKEDGRVDWTMSPRQVLNRLRAFRTWPNLYFFYRGTRIIIEEAQTFADNPLAKTLSGQILEVSSKGIVVAAAGGALKLTRLKPEGKKSMLVEDFLRGFFIREGELLE